MATVVWSRRRFCVWGPVAESFYGSFSGEVADQFLAALVRTGCTGLVVMTT